MKRFFSFDLVGWLRRHHLLPERMTQATEAEDLLKQLYERATTSAEASPRLTSRDLGLSPEHLEQLLSLLVRSGYVHPHSLRLTPEGERRALELTRAHRLYELYLAEHSGYAPEEWHRIAHSREHELSAEEHERIALLLGNPLFDPHGDPIPTPKGHAPHQPEALPIEALHVGRWYRVLHVEDDEAESYRLLTEAGLTRDSVFRLDQLESARSLLRYEGETLSLPTFTLLALTLQEATEEELRESHATTAERLTRLPLGQEAMVCGLSPACRGAMRRRLMDLGFVPGSRIAVDMPSPLGNPTAYIVRGAAIALRSDQARYILIHRPS